MPFLLAEPPDHKGQVVMGALHAAHMLPAWLPAPAATKICQTTKRSKRQIKVFQMVEFCISPGEAGQ